MSPELPGAVIFYTFYQSVMEITGSGIISDEVNLSIAVKITLKENSRLILPEVFVI